MHFASPRSLSTPPVIRSVLLPIRSGYNGKQAVGNGSMPARDVHHMAVRRALERDGWTVTHDPLHLRGGGRDFYIDLGAERLIAAEKAGQRIAVEVKSFIGRSLVADLEQALGQFVLYRGLLRRAEPERSLYLAVDVSTFGRLFAAPLGRLLLDDEQVQVLVFHPGREEVVQWVSAP